MTILFRVLGGLRGSLLLQVFRGLRLRTFTKDLKEESVLSFDLKLVGLECKNLVGLTHNGFDVAMKSWSNVQHVR